MLSIFIPFNFTRNQQLIKIKQEDHISSMLTIGLIFFLARACQHKTRKIGITILSHPQLKLHILQNYKHSKALIQLYFIHQQKYYKLYISYFYKILHFNRNPTKFCSPKLDIQNSTYDFSKIVHKSMKEITENLNCSH